MCYCLSCAGEGSMAMASVYRIFEHVDLPYSPENFELLEDLYEQASFFWPALPLDISSRSPQPILQHQDRLNRLRAVVLSILRSTSGGNRMSTDNGMNDANSWPNLAPHQELDQELPQNILPEGVVYQNQVQPSNQQSDFASYSNHPAPENYSIQQNVFPSFSNPSSSVPQPYYYQNNNTTALAPSVWDPPYLFSFPFRFSDTDLVSTPLPSTNPHPATPCPSIEHPQPHLGAPLNAAVSGNAMPRPSKKFKCCNKIMRSDNLIVHLRSVHGEAIPHGTRLRNWIHNHPNCTASDV